MLKQHSQLQCGLYKKKKKTLQCGPWRFLIQGHLKQTNSPLNVVDFITEEGIWNLNILFLDLPLLGYKLTQVT